MLTRKANWLGSQVFLGLISLMVLLPIPMAWACLWDSDTLEMERRRYPTTLELITGKFLRHSPEFYQWRIQDRLERLRSEPSNVSLYDDLGVAYDKLGQHDRALAMAEKAEQIQPGRYETAANLGTFYFHSGKFSEGLPQIERALKINPDAHFGREKYQKLLVEYMLKQRAKDPKKLPLADVELTTKPNHKGESARDGTYQNDFLSFLFQHESRPDQKDAAIKGILGMMRFGHHDSPILLEALGFLLKQDDTGKSKMLASRAFLKASYEAPSGTPREAYRFLAAHALIMKVHPGSNNRKVSLEEVEQDFLQELQEGQIWYGKLHQQETDWIREGINPEKQFTLLYDRDPSVTNREFAAPLPGSVAGWRFKPIVSILALISMVLSTWILTRLFLTFLRKR